MRTVSTVGLIWSDGWSKMRPYRVLSIQCGKAFDWVITCTIVRLRFNRHYSLFAMERAKPSHKSLVLAPLILVRKREPDWPQIRFRTTFSSRLRLMYLEIGFLGKLILRLAFWLIRLKFSVKDAGWYQNRETNLRLMAGFWQKHHIYNVLRYMEINFQKHVHLCRKTNDEIFVFSKERLF